MRYHTNWCYSHKDQFLWEMTVKHVPHGLSSQTHSYSGIDDSLMPTLGAWIQFLSRKSSDIDLLIINMNHYICIYIYWNWVNQSSKIWTHGNYVIKQPTHSLDQSLFIYQYCSVPKWKVTKACSQSIAIQSEGRMRRGSDFESRGKHKHGVHDRFPVPGRRFRRQNLQTQENSPKPTTKNDAAMEIGDALPPPAKRSAVGSSENHAQSLL